MTERTFRNLQGVAVYLRALGWKVSKSTVYEHSKLKKIKSREDGFYYLSDVETYASTHLKQKNIPHNLQSLDAIQRRRNEAEARKMEAQAYHWEIKAQVAKGTYIERAAFERGLSQRAMIFKADIEAFFRTQAAAIITLVDGNKDKTPDLIEYMLSAAATWLNRYAEDREFIVPAPDIDFSNDFNLDDSIDENEDNDLGGIT